MEKIEAVFTKTIANFTAEMKNLAAEHDINMSLSLHVGEVKDNSASAEVTVMARNVNPKIYTVAATLQESCRILLHLLATDSDAMGAVDKLSNNDELYRLVTRVAEGLELARNFNLSQTSSNVVDGIIERARDGGSNNESH